MQEVEQLENDLFGAVDAFEIDKEAIAPVYQKGKNQQPVWHDSGDQAVQVDVSVQARLQKLRQDGDNDVIVSGDDYQSRLRKQYTKLHSNTGWADKAVAASPR